MKSIGKMFKNILYIIVIICSLSLIGTKLFTGTASIYGYMPIFIMTDSMEPTIHAKSFIIMEVVRSDDIKVGDIIAYRYKEGIASTKIIHRVVGITKDGNYIFKGDNNPKRDVKDVSPKQILYRKISITHD